MPIQAQEYKDFSRRIWDKSVVSHLPTRVQFEITYRCNIHCVHCYTDPFNTPTEIRRELTLEEILRIFDELREAGVLWMLLTGGEAFVHPKFKQIYKEARARGFIISIFSNGTTLTDDLADFLAEDPPFKLEVSCHGATQATFDKVTQVSGSFERFQEGIRRILDRGLPLKFKTKAMTVNHHELPQIKEFIESLGFEFDLYTKIYPRLNGDISSTQYRLSPAEILDLEFGDLMDSGEADLCRTEDENESGRFHPQPPQDDRLFRCGCGTNSLTISPYGILRACTFTTWPAFDLREIPLRQAFRRLVETIREARYSGESLCRICPVYRFCDKNPVMAQYEAESMEAPVVEFCEVAYQRAEKTSPTFSHES